MNNRVYNTNMVNTDTVERKGPEYNWINVFIDKTDNNRVWASVYYSEYRRTKRVSKEKIIEFSSYDEMMEYVRSHFDTYEIDHFVPLLQKRIFLHYVDYFYVRKMIYDSSPDSNHIEVGYREYNYNGFKDNRMSLEPRYESMIIKYLRANRRVPKNMPLGPDLYQVVDVNKKINKSNPDTPRVTRVERRKNTIPMPAPKVHHPVRNLVIFASLAVLVTIMGEGIFLNKRRYDSSDGISLDKKIFQDFKLLWDKNNIGDTLIKLAREEYQDVSSEEARNLFNYIEKLELSNHDNNDTLNKVLLSEFKYDVPISKEKTDLFDRIDNLYENCFQYVNGKCELNKEAAKKFVDFTLPMILMNNGLYRSSSTSSVPRNLGSYNRNDPSPEEINAYYKLPMALQIVISEKTRWILWNMPADYTLKYPQYFGEKDKSGIIGTLNETIKVNISEVEYKCQVAQEKDGLMGKK